jgi:hypothetical protein
MKTMTVKGNAFYDTGAMLEEFPLFTPRSFLREPQTYQVASSDGQNWICNRRVRTTGSAYLASRWRKL